MAAVAGFPPLTDIKYRDLVALTSTVPNAIQWAKAHGLLHQVRICPVRNCGRNMREVARIDIKDGLMWRCTCGKRIGYRVGTFFEHSHLSISQVIVYCIVLVIISCWIELV